MQFPAPLTDLFDSKNEIVVLNLLRMHDNYAISGDQVSLVEEASQLMHLVSAVKPISVIPSLFPQFYIRCSFTLSL